MRFKSGTSGQGWSGVRWTVAALLFFATTVNYLDRQIFALLVPKFEGDLRLGPLDLSLINVSFLLCYGFGMLLVGHLIDRVGTRRGLAASFVLWNLASVAHGFVHSRGAFMLVRGLLGFGEAGNFPGATKAVAEWFPKKERATAFGILNSGSNIGFVVASVAAPLLTEKLGLSWQTCFVVLGGIGFVWIFFWLARYRKPTEDRNVSPEELALIKSDPDSDASSKPMSYPELLGIRPLYGIALAKAITDAPWWFYLTWLPKFLTDQFHLKASTMAAALPPIFIFADLGAIGGGCLSSTLIARGFEVGRSRKTAMLVCALCAVPVACIGILDPASPTAIYFAISLMSVAAAAHQGWSSNIYTLVSDIIPKAGVGMAVGVITMFGVVGGAAFQFYVGASVQGGSYAGPFILAGFSYLLGLAVLQLIVPVVKPEEPRGRLPIPLAWSGVVAMLGCLAVVQFLANRPPYVNLAEYRTRRPVEIKLASATPRDGPSAKVGWMDARWVLWVSPGNRTEAELIKFDDHGHPFVEGKGAAAPKYFGPSQAEIDRLTARS